MQWHFQTLEKSVGVRFNRAERQRQQQINCSFNCARTPAVVGGSFPETKVVLFTRYTQVYDHSTTMTITCSGNRRRSNIHH
jgi:hypothetical protein